MSRTAWKWVVASLIAFQGLTAVIWLLAPARDAFGHSTRTIYAVLLAIAAGSWLLLWLRRGTTGVREALDHRAAPAPAFAEARSSYLILLAAWIVAGIGFAYYLAFVKG